MPHAQKMLSIIQNRVGETDFFHNISIFLTWINTKTLSFRTQQCLQDWAPRNKLSPSELLAQAGPFCRGPLCSLLVASSWLPPRILELAEGNIYRNQTYSNYSKDTFWNILSWCFLQEFSLESIHYIHWTILSISVNKLAFCSQLDWQGRDPESFLNGRDDDDDRRNGPGDERNMERCHGTVSF